MMNNYLYIEGQLKKLKVPTLLVWGRDDQLMAPELAEQAWKQFYPHSEMHIVPKAGHFIQEDAPEEVIAIIKDFLSRNP